MFMWIQSMPDQDKTNPGYLGVLRVCIQQNVVNILITGYNINYYNNQHKFI